MSNPCQSRWMTEYLDAFDNYCETTECSKCPVRPIKEKNKDKSCFRIYCELRDAESQKKT